MTPDFRVPYWRTAAERLTHRIVLRRRLPRPFRPARIYVSSEGGLRYLGRRMSAVDPPLLRMAVEAVADGAVVWDIGANLGLFSFAAAASAGPAGRVLAVEPDAWLVQLLRRSAEANHGLAPVEVLPVAVAERPRIGRFSVARRNRATSHLDGYGSTQTNGTRHTGLVPVVSLDWLLDYFPSPDVLKIDVEEAELLVLSGATSVLAARPLLICEVARRNAYPVGRLLRQFGYEFFDGTVEPRRRLPLDDVPWSLLARPASGSGPFRAQRLDGELEPGMVEAEP